jgi:4,5-DOPA dioxygenase extradiol
MQRLPVLFLAHGNPMNAIQDTPVSRAFADLGQRLQKPRAIVCISAHWMTQGFRVTSQAHPKTIHDFYGFPAQLNAVQYPAPGHPELAQAICSESQGKISLDASWGFDHGTWSVLRHLFPKADIPVVQVSIDLHASPSAHYEIGTKLRTFRDQGVLIIGSGNITHNLRRVDFSGSQPTPSWAENFDRWVANQVESRNHPALTENFMEADGAEISVPTPDHYLPLISALGATFESEKPETVFTGFELGSISLRSLAYGLTS